MMSSAVINATIADRENDLWKSRFAKNSHQFSDTFAQRVSVAEFMVCAFGEVECRVTASRVGHTIHHMIGRQKREECVVRWHRNWEFILDFGFHIIYEFYITLIQKIFIRICCIRLHINHNSHSYSHNNSLPFVWRSRISFDICLTFYKYVIKFIVCQHDWPITRLTPRLPPFLLILPGILYYRCLLERPFGIQVLCKSRTALSLTPL